MTVDDEDNKEQTNRKKEKIISLFQKNKDTTNIFVFLLLKGEETADTWTTTAPFEEKNHIRDKYYSFNEEQDKC